MPCGSVSLRMNLTRWSDDGAHSYGDCSSFADSRWRMTMASERPELKDTRNVDGEGSVLAAPPAKWLPTRRSLRSEKPAVCCLRTSLLLPCALLDLSLSPQAFPLYERIRDHVSHQNTHHRPLQDPASNPACWCVFGSARGSRVTPNVTLPNLGMNVAAGPELAAAVSKFGYLALAARH